MPVPVPRISKVVAHPVHKQADQSGLVTRIDTGLFTNSALTTSPAGPSPLYGAREDWISSRPAWNSTKPHRIWEDDECVPVGGRQMQQHFHDGLARAVNARAIKGTLAQASIPPFHTLLAYPDTECRRTGCVDISPESSVFDMGYPDHQSQWSASSPAEAHRQLYTDTPVFDDRFPELVHGHDVGSSPIGPLTPFGAYVDRAVSAKAVVLPPLYAAHPAVQHDAPICPPAQEKPAPPAPEPVATQGATLAYRRLAEPLSEWLASYIWKVCTTGLSLPEIFAQPSATFRRSEMPPTFLAGSIHSILLSTLLQPSAIFLAVWYMVRLPVYYDAADLDLACVNERKFRLELLDPSTGLDRETAELQAPFKLFLLGCMLANKWLDDHTFSNKTWHSISNIPIKALNRLESLALAIFGHDLSVSTVEWSRWMSHVNSYHRSMLPPLQHPQPISRPSSNPHSIIKKSIEEIIEASVLAATNVIGGPQPIYVGVEERRNAKYSHEEEVDMDVLEIDLDEDGPLRDEYLPKRRISRSGSLRRDLSNSGAFQDRTNTIDPVRFLPPPAKWSPAADEPILRERSTGNAQYVAVRPSYAVPSQSSTAFLPGFEEMTKTRAWADSFSRDEYASRRYSDAIPWTAVPIQAPGASLARSHSLNRTQESQPPVHTRTQSRHSVIQYGFGQLASAAWHTGHSWTTQNGDTRADARSFASHANLFNHLGPLLRV